MSEVVKTPGALRNPEFLKFWIGETVSLMGAELTRFALPLVAVLSLSASAFEVGVVNAMRYGPIVVVSLFAGVWLDRRRRRPVLIASNLGRALFIALVPIAALSGFLSIWLLCVVAVAIGTLTVIFDVGSLSFVPSVVDRSQLADANGRLQTSFSLAMIAGPSLGGLLVGLLTAPVTLTVNAVSYLFSVVMIRSMRVTEPEPEPPAEHVTLRDRIAEGLRAVYGSAVLRNLLTQSATFNLAQNAMFTVFVVYAVRTVGLSAKQLGLVLGIGAFGSLFGALTANRVTKSLGLGRTLRAATFTAALAPLLILTARGDGIPSVAVLTVAHALAGYMLVIYNVNTVTLRQVVTPNRLLGRMNASYRMVLFGTIPLGALLGGALGQYLGLRPAMVITVLLLTTPIVWTFFSPVFRLPEMPTGPVDDIAVFTEPRPETEPDTASA
ncbi:MFS transporter [Microtetraspora niveoalba]|uniref:MFS transporter n=1 Tax=Microtetraspora niveoalba TaxID=46175 RepID=UPI0008375020|nr:MFS transporter [Microtetraspora niveoalba]